MKLFAKFLFLVLCSLSLGIFATNANAGKVKVRNFTSENYRVYAYGYSGAFKYPNDTQGMRWLTPVGTVDGNLGYLYSYPDTRVCVNVLRYPDNYQVVNVCVVDGDKVNIGPYLKGSRKPYVTITKN